MISDYGARLMLADVFYLQDTRKVCSGLAVLAEAAALAQAAKPFAGILWLGPKHYILIVCLSTYLLFLIAWYSI